MCVCTREGVSVCLNACVRAYGVSVYRDLCECVCA